MVKESDIQYVYENNKWVTTSNDNNTSLDLALSPRIDIGYALSHSVDLVFSTSAPLVFDSSLLAVIPWYNYGQGLRIEL